MDLKVDYGVESKSDYVKRVKEELKSMKDREKSMSLNEVEIENEKQGQEAKINFLYDVEVDEKTLKRSIEKLFRLLPKQTEVVRYDVTGYDDTPVFESVHLSIKNWPEYVYELDSFEESLKKADEKLAKEVCDEIAMRLGYIGDLVLPYCWYDSYGGRCEVVLEKDIKKGKINMEVRINWFEKRIEEKEEVL